MAELGALLAWRDREKWRVSSRRSTYWPEAYAATYCLSDIVAGLLLMLWLRARQSNARALMQCWAANGEKSAVDVPRLRFARVQHQA